MNKWQEFYHMSVFCHMATISRAIDKLMLQLRFYLREGEACDHKRSSSPKSWSFKMQSTDFRQRWKTCTIVIVPMCMYLIEKYRFVF